MKNEKGIALAVNGTLVVIAIIGATKWFLVSKHELSAAQNELAGASVACREEYALNMAMQKGESRGPYACEQDVLLYKSVDSCEVAGKSTLKSEACQNLPQASDEERLRGVGVPLAKYRVFGIVGGTGVPRIDNPTGHQFAETRKKEEQWRYFKNGMERRCFRPGQNWAYIPYPVSFNCHGHALSTVIGNRFDIWNEKSALLASYCRKVERAHVREGDIADYGGHTGIVSRVTERDVTVFGKDGKFGTYEGPQAAWVGYGWVGYWRCMPMHKKIELCRAGTTQLRDFLARSLH